MAPRAGILLWSCGVKRRIVEEAPWWISAAELICSACFQPFAYGSGARCVDCDVELCSICGVAVREAEVVCSPCQTGGK